MGAEVTVLLCNRLLICLTGPHHKGMTFEGDKRRRKEIRKYTDCVGTQNYTLPHAKHITEVLMSSSNCRSMNAAISDMIYEVATAIIIFKATICTPCSVETQLVS